MNDALSFLICGMGLGLIFGVIFILFTLITSSIGITNIFAIGFACAGVIMIIKGVCAKFKI